jgi:hypothetical protein
LDEFFALGQPGLRADPFDHICVFHRGRQERDEVLIPFLAQGMADGDRCVCVVEASDRAGLLDALDRGPGADPASSDGLQVLDWDATYLRTGTFSPADMQSFWADELLCSDSAPDPRVVRCACDMSWVLDEVPSIVDLTTYECGINRLRPGYRYVALCLYDIQRFSGETVIQMLKTHPKVLMSGALFENPYYLQPEELSISV